MILRQIFKDDVKYYIKQLRLSQEKLAELFGLSTNYIDKIEKTNRKSTIDTIEKVANGFNMGIMALSDSVNKIDIYKVIRKNIKNTGN